MYQISSESPEFYRRYYKNILVFFSGHTVLNRYIIYKLSIQVFDKLSQANSLASDAK